MLLQVALSQIAGCQESDHWQACDGGRWKPEEYALSGSDAQVDYYTPVCLHRTRC